MQLVQSRNHCRTKRQKVSDMKPTKILCPVDFSPCSNVAFQHAIDLARGSKAALVLAHVSAPPPTYISGYAGYGALPPYQPEPDPRLEEMKVAIRLRTKLRRMMLQMVLPTPETSQNTSKLQEAHGIFRSRVRSQRTTNDTLSRIPSKVAASLMAM